MDLTKYKDIFGKPNEGVHSYRFLNLALVDIIVTIIFGILIGLILNKIDDSKSQNKNLRFSIFSFNIIKIIVLLFLLGIVLHRLFCVRTTIDRLLFPNVND